MITPAFTPPVRYAILVGGLDFEQENGKLGVQKIIDELEVEFRERGFRVACVSNNTPRRLDMIAYLKEYAVPVYDISVTDTNFSAKIIQLLTL